MREQEKSFVEPRSDPHGHEIVKKQMINQIFGLEMRQLAESIEQINAVRKPVSENLPFQIEPRFFEDKNDNQNAGKYQEKEYLLQFDLSLKYPTVWVS